MRIARQTSIDVLEKKNASFWVVVVSHRIATDYYFADIASNDGPRE
jgi:hypothetical protein